MSTIQKVIAYVTILLLPSVDRRAKRITGAKKSVSGKLHSLEHRRNIASLSIFYRIHFGVCI